MVLGCCVLAFAAVGQAAFVESGPIEMLSAIGYGLASIICIAWAVRTRRWRDGVPASVLLAILCARELDMHKATPVGSLTRSATYVDPAIPLSWRIMAFLAVLAALVATLAFGIRMVRRWRDGSIRMDARTANVLLAVALLGLAKAFDGIGRKLADVGITIGPSADATFHIMEESLELAAPILLLIVAVNLFHRSGPRASER